MVSKEHTIYLACCTALNIEGAQIYLACCASLGIDLYQFVYSKSPKKRNLKKKEDFFNILCDTMAGRVPMHYSNAAAAALE